MTNLADPAHRLEQYATDRSARPLALLRRRGDGSKAAPLLLLHGSSLQGSLSYSLTFDGRSAFDGFGENGRDVWQLDFRGYGLSWKPADDGARPSAPVADTAQAIEDLRLAIDFIRAETSADAVDLFGWSWGATTAAAYAAGGGALGRLVLHAPQWLRDTPSPMVTPATMSEPYRAIELGSFVDKWLERIDPASRQLMQRWEPALRRALEGGPILVPNGSARDIAAHWMAGRPGYDPRDIRAPALVIVGAADRDTPPKLARAVFDRLGSAQKSYVEVPLGTHFTLLEPARDDLFPAVAAFLDEHS